MVCCLLGNFLPLGNNYLPLSCDSLRIDIDSTLEGVLPNSYWGNFSLHLSRELIMCLRLKGESVYDTRFTWDLVYGLDSQRSFHDDVWSTEGCLMLLIHWWYFWWFRSTRDTFDPLGMLLRVFMLFAYWGHSCYFWVYFWNFLCTSSLLGTP